MPDNRQHFLFLTDILDKKLYLDQQGTYIGKIVDVVASTKEVYPEITKLVVSPGWFKERLTINWEHVLPFELPISKLLIRQEGLSASFQLNINEILLKETFLDKQVVDVSGCKVVRVNDLHLLKEQHKILVVHIDIGFRAIIRRLGWEKILTSLLNWLFAYKLSNQLISWKYIHQVATEQNHLGLTSLRLKTSFQKLSTIHPADLAEILLDLSRDGRLELFKHLAPNTAAEVLGELNLENQRRLIEGLSRDKRNEIFNLMLPDKAADLLSYLSPRRREEIMRHLPPDKMRVIKGLMVHPEETAGSLMTNQYLALAPQLTVEEALAIVKQKASQVIAFYYIYIVDETQALLGVVTLRRLLSASPETKLIEIMHPQPIKVRTNTSEQRVATLFRKYNFGAIPVVDTHNKLLGIIIFKDVMDKILPTVGAKSA